MFLCSGMVNLVMTFSTHTEVFMRMLHPTVVGNWNVVNTSYFNQDLTAAAANSSHVEDATYFELNNITVGYNLKDVTKFMSNLRVYVSAQTTDHVYWI